MKQFISMSSFLLLMASLWAQSGTAGDTIFGRSQKYHYTEWYDECSIFQDSNKFIMYPVECGPTGILVKQQYTDKRIPVKGVMAMVTIYQPTYLQHHRRTSEYMMIYQYTTTAPDSMLLLGTVRWDTVTPKVMKLPKWEGATDDVTDFMYCCAFEAYFDKPVMVDSIFYIGSTNNNSQYVPENGNYMYDVTHYMAITPRQRDVCTAQYDTIKLTDIRIDSSYTYRWFNAFPNNRDKIYGLFLPIVDNHRLTVVSDSLELGTVEGDGFFPEGTYDTIRAIPQPGYKFTHWNDGNSDNPRAVCLMQDTSFTAYFDELQHYTVTVEVNNADWGTATGAGTYEELQPVTLTAQPATGFYFHHWDDGNGDNPRIITLTQDTAFTAVFSDHIGVDAPERLPFTLYPNPAGTTLTIAVGTADRYRVEIFDAAGRRAATADFEGDSQQFDVSQLPAGHYLLQLSSCGSTPQRASAQPFVKQ